MHLNPPSEAKQVTLGIERVLPRNPRIHFGRGHAEVAGRSIGLTLLLVDAVASSACDAIELTETYTQVATSREEKIYDIHRLLSN